MTAAVKLALFRRICVPTLAVLVSLQWLWVLAVPVMCVYEICGKGEHWWKYVLVVILSPVLIVALPLLQGWNWSRICFFAAYCWVLPLCSKLIGSWFVFYENELIKAAMDEGKNERNEDGVASK